VITSKEPEGTAMAEAKRIAILGAAGRMGRANIAAVLDAGPEIALSGAVDRAGSPHIGADAGSLVGRDATGVIIGDDPAPVIAWADAVIDFTTPAATLEAARLAAQAGAALVVGTTGLSPEQEAELSLAARHVPVVYAANYSIGVTLLTELTRQVAATLDPSWDIEIVEMHHRHKVDAPSGTALALGKAAALGRDVAHDAVKRAARDGHTGPREEGTIGYAVLRGGDVVGEHTVVFAGTGERVELGHKAAGRGIFSQGALRAARWAMDQKPGLYDMVDVLGLRRDQ
jgi:4-hydroxy-tetrahydrodipicolinate reductase